MDRRHFLRALGAASLFPSLAFAQDDSVNQGAPAKDPSVRPYVSVGPFKEDAAKVYFFFSYSCPFCFEYRKAIASYGETLPKSITLIPMPVVVKGDPLTIAAAASHYVVKMVAPERLTAFVDLAYERSRGAFVTPDTYLQILREMKIEPPTKPGAKDQLKAQMNRVDMLMHRYKVDATPHFGICGKYGTNANFTNGDYRMLNQLLNALVSQHLGAGS